MIFENIDIHGCARLEKLQNGAHATVRVPQYVYDVMTDSARVQAESCTGIEFRFVLESDSAVLGFRYNEGESGRITVYYGDFVADWPDTDKTLKGECEAVIKKPENIETLRALAKQYGHRFSPDVVRLVFEGVRPHIVSVDGKISPPPAEMCPTKKYLAYGSSITHGSISLHPYYYYAERVAANLGADATNYGFAGSARLEKEMADFIADECEFDFATLEMGINILKIEPEDYENRVRYFVSRIAKAHPDSKIFAIDVYYCKSDIEGDSKAECFRKILQRVVCELSLPNVVYVNGKTVLPDGSKLTTGLVHPNPDGVMEITRNLTEIISSNY